ncbi:MAG: AIPR family protein [Ruminiclostridium sp.]|nr:AIPR family protein [Ruminiclostridium sp.]
MDTSKFKFKVQSVRTLRSPYAAPGDSDSYETIYYVLVNMQELPDSFPLDVNPREPKMNTSVAKSLKKAVKESDTDFYLNNRGIVISAKSFSFDPSSATAIVDLGNQTDETDRMQYGILDGGHTYTAIIQERDNIPRNVTKYVRLEIITNVNNITRLSDARNTSVQVSDIALFNLDGKFENINDAIKGQPYEGKIAYKDNERNDIHVYEILRLMYAFDIDKFPDDSMAPIQSYSGKAQVFKRYKDAYDSEFYKLLVKEIPTLVTLYDTIETELHEKYVIYKRELGTANPRFGGVRGIDNKDDASSFFLKNPMQYSISSGYLYPIFGAFRAILSYDEEDQILSWMFDPIEIWNEVGKALAQNTFESSSNPQLAGKDKQLWLSNYRIVETQCLRKLLKKRG